jgi:hypothetical protein
MLWLPFVVRIPGIGRFPDAAWNGLPAALER